MPKVTVSDKKGLVQEAGAGITFKDGFNDGGVKILSAGAGNTLTAADSGKTIVFGVAAATLVKLPAPRLGMHFTFVSSILATGDHEIQAATNGHGYLGGICVISTTAAKADAFSANANGADDFITMNGGTTGGGAGSAIRIVALKDSSQAGCWGVSGVVHGVGSTMATPFATS
jgi:hypothetical protein